MALPQWLQDEFDIEREWNDLDTGTDVIIQRNNQFFFGRVEKLEKKRNCHMLHINVEDHFDNTGAQIVGRRSYGRHGYGAVVPVHGHQEWKKVAGTLVWDWKKALKPGRAKRKDPHYKDPNEPSLDDLLKKTAEKRKAYAAQRQTLVATKALYSECFGILGLTPDVTQEEFKRVRREVAMKWHPDRLAQFMNEGKGSESEFVKVSKQQMDALAEVQSYINRRDEIQKRAIEAAQGE